MGNTYYYDASEEHLSQAFYDSIQVEHAQDDMNAATTRPSSTPASSWRK